MHFLIFSDSHGHPENINKVLKRAGRYDGVFFLGDGIRDLDYCDFSTPVLYAVKGNCDMFYSSSEDFCDKREIVIGNKKILITHGHSHGVKSSLGSLIYDAAERDADIVLFGHTHQRFERRYTPEDSVMLSKPLYVFNPGAISGYAASFGCLDITSRGEILLSHGEL